MREARTLLALALLLTFALTTDAGATAYATDHMAVQVRSEGAASFPLDPVPDADEPDSGGIALAFATTIAGIAFVSTVFVRNRRAR